MPLLERDDRGLFCPAGNFHVDPWRPVPRAVVTHAHADHARPGMGRYLTTIDGEHVLRPRVGRAATIDTLDYGERLSINGVTVSLHPAGHILGSAQVRLEHGGEVCVISGDFKCDATPDGSVVPTEDRTCRAFEPVRCHAFVTESTFGLPVYKWPPQEDVFAELNKWWASNRDAGKASVLFSYSLGKAQRLLAGADASIGPVFCHGAVETCNRGYRDAGVELPETTPVGQKKGARLFAGSLIVAPPSANGTTWMRRFGECSTAFASGWMLVRGQRRRRAVDRGFVLSDHADWDGLLAAIKDSGAEKILVTHGNRDTLVKYLREQDVDAEMLDAWFEGGEEADEVPGTEAADEDGDPVTDGDTSREGDTPQA